MRLLHLSLVGVLALSASAVAACSSTPAKTSGTTTGSGGAGGEPTGTGGMEDAGTEAAAPFKEGPFPAPPKVTDFGGPVIKAPKIVPVFFAGDDAALQAQIADFVSKVGATTYWTAATSEYGVGAATALPPVQLTETAPTTIDDTAIQTWLQGKLNGNDPAWPANDANTLYALHYPAGTTITLDGTQSCTYFGGYHNDTQLDANHASAYVAYAVIPRCSSFDTQPPLTGIDAVTGPESHELVEAVTDPYPQDDPAYVTVDSAHFYWTRVLGGGEVGDMCAQFDGSFTKFPGLDYTVQRIWSNKNAAAGHDPCQPEPTGEVYFNAAPVLPDSLTLSNMGTTVFVKGVEIALGQSQTIDVQLFSDGPTTGPWTVAAENTSTMSSPLSFAWDKNTGVNGDVLHLTITVNTAGKRGSESFILTSTLGGTVNAWIGIVGTPAVTDGGVEAGFDGGGDSGTEGDAGSAADGGDGG